MAAALFGLGAITGPLFGPTIGGYLIEWSSWHWIFMVNVPLGCIAALLALRFIEEPGFKAPSGASAKVDVLGIALLGVGMASLQTCARQLRRARAGDTAPGRGFAGIR
jgi:DHA2 family multidrug resistance protein